MKIMSRDFTRMERILLIVLALILVGLAYYYFVDTNVRSAIDIANADAEEYQSQLDTLQVEVQRLQGIKNAMDELEASGNMSWMGSYNNSEEELKFLNDILAQTLQYSISFSNVTRSGDQIRRSFSLQYRAVNYEAAREIITKLDEGSVNRCVVGDMRCSIATDGTVSMSMSCTFFETMVDGTPDAALPRDTAATNS